MDGFPFETPVVVRFRDIDAMGHVNNAVYGTYFELAREAFFKDVFGVASATDYFYILARLEVDFRRPVKYEDSVRVGLRVSRLGRTSFTFEYRIEASGEVAAEGKTVQVAYDYGAGRTMPVPEAHRQKLAAFLAPAP